MKKKYQKPEIELVEFDQEVYMVSLSLEGVGDKTEEDSDVGADANRHRGEWGNLWAED